MGSKLESWLICPEQVPACSRREPATIQTGRSSDSGSWPNTFPDDSSGFIIGKKAITAAGAVSELHRFPY